MDLNQVTVLVTNVERSIIFYEKLGLRLIVKALPYYARFACTDGSSTFSLHQTDEPIGNSGPWIYFEVQNLDETVRKLTDQGICFEELPNDKPWLWREARLKDPDSNQLILYFAGKNRHDPPWKV